MRARTVRARQHFEFLGRAARSVYTFCWGVVFVVGVAMMFVDVSRDAAVVRVIGIVIAIAAGWLFVRSFVWATIDLYPDAVVVRGFLKTSRIAVADIDSFTLVKGVDASDEPATALAVRTRDGRTRVFSDLAKRDSGTPYVAHLVDRLNESLVA
jgi:hypothetical protein